MYIRWSLTALFLFLPCAMPGQGTLADYQRAAKLRTLYQAAALNIPEAPHWLEDDRFWYRKSIPGGHAFVLVDATGIKTAAFDHEKLAAALSKAAGQSFTAVALPFSNVNFVDHGQALEVVAAEFNWKCSLADYSCDKSGPASSAGPGTLPRNRALQAQQENQPAVSPDGNWEVVIKNFNIFLRPKGKTGGTLLSLDGSVAWSPDSKKLAGYRVRSGYRREVHYVESSPADQLQPKHTTIEYAKPGDVLDFQQPVLFLVDEKKEIVIDNNLFPNPTSYRVPGRCGGRTAGLLLSSTTSAGTRRIASSKWMRPPARLVRSSTKNRKHSFATRARNTVTTSTMVKS
jgi:hypothetical protein